MSSNAMLYQAAETIGMQSPVMMHSVALRYDVAFNWSINPFFHMARGVARYRQASNRHTTTTSDLQ
jgi:hypothetical protein